MNDVVQIVITKKDGFFKVTDMSLKATVHNVHCPDISSVIQLLKFSLASLTEVNHG